MECLLEMGVFPAEQSGLAAPASLTPCPASAPDPCPQKVAAPSAPGMIQERDSRHKIQRIEEEPVVNDVRGEKNCTHQKETGALFHLVHSQQEQICCD